MAADRAARGVNARAHMARHGKSTRGLSEIHQPHSDVFATWALRKKLSQSIRFVSPQGSDLRHTCV